MFERRINLDYSYRNITIFFLMMTPVSILSNSKGDVEAEEQTTKRREGQKEKKINLLFCQDLIQRSKEINE